MFCYFSSATPCALKVNGNFVGKVTVNPSFLDLEQAFLEFVPLDQSLDCACYLLDKNQPVSCKNVQIIDLYGGFLFLPKFVRKSFGSTEIVVNKIFPLNNPVQVSCFNQGDGKIFLRTESDLFIESTPFALTDVRFESCAFNGREYLLIICVCGKTVIYGYEIGKKITPVFKNVCDGFGFDGNLLRMFENKNDLLRHTLSTTWEFADSVKLKSQTITAKRAVYSLPDALVPYAFFEEILLGGDVANFLTPRLKPRAKEFKEFLGDFKGILPPPHFVGDDFVTLLYADKVEYAKVHVHSGQVDNVTIET